MLGVPYSREEEKKRKAETLAEVVNVS